jgi:hypothetical protein
MFLQAVDLGVLRRVEAPFGELAAHLGELRLGLRDDAFQLALDGGRILGTSCGHAPSSGADGVTALR